MPLTDNTEAHELLDSIKNACVSFNENNGGKSPEISLSIGYATISDELELTEEALKTADEYMRNKGSSSLSKAHTASIISSIMTTVYEKSQETTRETR